MGPSNESRVGAGPGVGPEGWLKWSTQPLVVPRAGIMRRSCVVAPRTSEAVVGFLVFFYLVAHNLPQLLMYAVIFSPLYVLILLLEETFVQGQALQQRDPGSGPSLPHSPLRDFTPLILKG